MRLYGCFFCVVMFDWLWVVVSCVFLFGELLGCNEVLGWIDYGCVGSCNIGCYVVG